jgi:hypothetical protein
VFANVIAGGMEEINFIQKVAIRGDNLYMGVPQSVKRRTNTQYWLDSSHGKHFQETFPIL